MRNNLINTPTEYIGGKRYCSYCAKEAKYDYDYDEYDKIDYYWCECEGANLWHDIEILNRKLQGFVNEKELQRLRYNEELKKLKYKFKSWI